MKVKIKRSDFSFPMIKIVSPSSRDVEKLFAKAKNSFISNLSNVS